MTDDRYQLLNDQEEATRILLDGRQVGIWTALPGIVQSVDFTKMTCTVQPAIQAIVLDQTGTQKAINLPLLLDVPIAFPKGGGFVITMPLAVNDEVLVVFSSRCIDAWWQSGGVQQAMEARMHDLSDGFAIPGPWSVPNAPSSVSSTDVQIRNAAGTTYVSVGADGKVKLVSASEIDLTAPTVKINGDLTVSGGATITGAATAQGTNVHTHLHSGVTAGGANTGPPV